ncbi:tRNA pseudouridine(55) synthase TruB [Halomonas sp. HMF6819]|uniref:tRNA pseudouridine(55) synthase TruB n=1 Tax=Halomonas sp. HMF6819 TaxID=3373085 RepID=UPI0037A6025A
MARRRKGLPVNGVMLLDKPKGLSSNHALQRVRRLFEAQKAGHTGTLDPMATGLLPICLGEATKFSAHLLEADKMYRTRVELGVITDTGDAEGEVLERRAVPTLTEHDIEAAIARFRGEIDQVPPMYSALKHQGKKLYELAREGKEIERKARRVCIHEARLIGFEGATFELEVSVSKGTYIRTLAEDIGAVLGCGAHISALRRLKTGPFDSEAMWTLEEIEALADQPTREATLMPVDVLVDHLPALTVDDTGHQRLSHGQPAAIDATALGLENLARLYYADAFIGLGVVKGPQEVAPKRLLSTVARS